MDMQGSRALAITPQQAWDALNDPQVLQACIAGCERIEPAGENRYTAQVALKIGPVSARFNGRIALEDVVVPQRYTLRFDGQGGAAGFGKGQARVELAPAEGGRGCLLGYTVNAQVGGRIAQVGQRLIDGVARSMADDFFARFEAAMRERHPEAYATESIALEPDSSRSVAVEDRSSWRSALPWAAAAAVLALLLWWLLR